MAGPGASVRQLATTLAVAAIVAGCSGGDGESSTEEEVVAMRIEVTSTAFTEGARIPTKYTCDREDTSPPLRWSGVPEGARSIALIADAPGGTWVHWVQYAIPPDVAELPEGVATTEELPNGARQGTTDFKRVGYGGPCPPPGHGVHRYYFKLYALDADIDLGPGTTKSDLLGNMRGHVVAEGQLMGTYERK